jgi:hypothetical protein
MTDRTANDIISLVTVSRINIAVGLSERISDTRNATHSPVNDRVFQTSDTISLAVHRWMTSI